MRFEGIEKRIFLIRGQRVMLDRDLAELYLVPTFALNQAVKRNRLRFPEGFMFRLTPAETAELITNCDRFMSIKHSSVMPQAFTEYGVAMLSSVLRSKRAVRINVQIVSTFIRLRQWALTQGELSMKLAELEKKVASHDGQFAEVFEALRHLIEAPLTAKRRIGFK